MAIGPGLVSLEVQAATLLGAGVLLGGGGVGAALPNLAVQLLAIAILALNFDAVSSFVRSKPRYIVVLTVLTLGLPLLQLVPLPGAAWSALPGRALELESLELIGAEGKWRPLSLDPARTFVAFLGLLAPLAMLAVVSKMDDGARRRLIYVFLALVAANLMLGGLQVIAGRGAFRLFAGAHGSELSGTFSNRNSAAIFLAISECILIGLAFSRRHGEPNAVVIALAGALVVVGVLLTQSRSGVTLLVVPLVLLLTKLPSRHRAWLLPAALLLLAATAVGVMGTRLGETFARFDDLADSRPQIWDDARTTVSKYWPAGSGMGTFDEVFQVDESLEYVDPKTAGRAHNDYLELGIEAGPFGLLLVMGWIAAVMLGWWRARNSPGSPIRDAAMAGLVTVLAQSILDYPLRNQALLCVAAMLVAFVCLHESFEGKTNART